MREQLKEVRFSHSLLRTFIFPIFSFAQALRVVATLLVVYAVFAGLLPSIVLVMFAVAFIAAYASCVVMAPAAVRVSAAAARDMASRLEIIGYRQTNDGEWASRLPRWMRSTPFSVGVMGSDGTVTAGGPWFMLKRLIRRVTV